MTKAPVLILLIAAITFIPVTVSSATHLMGDISAVVFSDDAGPFIVESDIEVPVSKSIRIGPGCLFLFKPFTTLTVAGDIIVDGTEKAPVIFTSINDHAYSPDSTQAPSNFDWNGIVVKKTSTQAVFSYFMVMYSGFGIRSETEEVSISGGIFRQIGQFSCIIAEKLMPVNQGYPYSYNKAAITARNSLKQIAGVGSITIMSNPSGADIMIDGLARKEKTPFTCEGLTPGKHRVKATEGDLEAIAEITIDPEKAQTISLSLKIPPTLLKIGTNPPAAEVYLNKKITFRSFTLKKTPTMLHLPEHNTTKTATITLIKPEYGDSICTVEIRPHAVNEFFFNLRPTLPEEQKAQKQFFRKRAHFRFGVGLIAASLPCAVIGTLYLNAAGSDYRAADDIKGYLDASLVKSGPTYAAKVAQNKAYYNSGNRKTKYAISAFLAGVGLLGTGFVLQF